MCRGLCCEYCLCCVDYGCDVFGWMCVWGDWDGLFYVEDVRWCVWFFCLGGFGCCLWGVCCWWLCGLVLWFGFLDFFDLYDGGFLLDWIVDVIVFYFEEFREDCGFCDEYCGGCSFYGWGGGY